MRGPSRSPRTTRASKPSTSPIRPPRATGAFARPSCAPRMRGASCRAWWSCTRTAASIPTSKTSRGAWASPASWPSRRTGSRRWAATRANDDKGRELQATLDPKKMIEDFVAAAVYLKSHPECTGKVGVVGFCYGGGVANTLAVRLPDLAAAVPFYGMAPAAADVPKIKAPLLIHYAANGRAHQRGLAGLRGRAAGEQDRLHRVHLRGDQSRLPQRHDAALRQGRGHPRLGPDHRSSSTRTLK